MKLFSRIAALVLALALCLGLFSTAIADTTTTSNQQIVNIPDGYTYYYDATGDKLDDAKELGGDAVVEISKNIYGTKTENEFEIELQVKTTSRIDTIGPVSQDAAVLLIFDLSSSMNTKDMSKNTENSNPQKITRLAAAKEAAKKFINQFAELGYTDENGNTVIGKRMVGLVTFSTHAASHNWNDKKGLTGSVYWIDVSIEENRQLVAGNKESDKESSTKESGKKPSNNEECVIDQLKADGGTNLEAGLMLGRNLLADGQTKTPENGGIKDIQHVYTILLTDGKPTYHVPNHENSDNLAAVYGPNRFNSEEDKTGSSTEYDDVVNVGIMANGSKDDTIKGITNYSKLYSICFGKDGNSDPIYETYLKPTESNNNSSSGGGFPDSKPSIPTPTPDPNKDCWNVTIQKNDYKIAGTTYPKNESETNVVRTVGEWLSAFSSARAYDAQTDDMSGLFSAFNSIITHIKLSAQAWQVDDKMGDNIEFVRPIDVIDKTSSNPDEKVTNSATPPSAENNNTLRWNLLSSEPDPNITVIRTGEGETSTVGYTYKYKVRLNNLDGGYTAGVTATPTNESATLKYAMLKDGVLVPNPYEESDGTYTVAFPQPMVKGLVGKLEFTKVDGSGAALPDATFTLSLDTEKDKTGTWTSLTATSGDDGTVTFSNIPSGHSYTLTEIQAPDNYNLDSTSRSVEIKYGDEYVDKKQITETNPLKITNTAKTGSLTISKAFGEGSAITADSFPTGKTITFTVKKADGSDYTTVTLPENGRWTKNLTNVPLGTYTVTESGADVEGYTLTPTVTGLTNGSVTITSGKTAEVTFTNTYERNTGSLKIEKVFSGLPEGTDIPDVAFTVTGPDGYTKTFKRSEMTFTNGKYSYTINDLPTGEYTVTEDATTAGVSNYTLSPTYSPTDGKVTVSKGNEAKVSITNTYERDTGKLTITKANEGATPESVKFKVTGPDGYSAEVTLPIVGADGSKSWSKTLENLPTGTYTIAESGANVDGYSYTTKVKVNNGTESENTSTSASVTKGSEATVAFTNTYTQNKGGLAISKKFNFVTPSPMVGTVTTPAPSDRPEIVVEVKDANSQPVATALLNQGNNWSTTIPDLPVGDYTVTEVNSTEHPLDITGWTLTTPAPTTVTVASNTTAPTVEITNTYTRDTGSLTITKTNKGATPESVTFTVAGPDNYSTTVTLPIKVDGQSDQWNTTIDLPTGTYTVTETNADVDNFARTTTVSVNNGTAQALTNNGVSVEVKAGEGNSVTVAFTNTYVANPGQLKLVKSIAYSENSVEKDAAVTEVTLTVSRDGVGTSPEEIVGSYTLNDENEWQMVIDVPAGTYYVTETAQRYNDADYSVETTYTNQTVTVAPGQKVTDGVTTNVVTVTNTYTRDTGSLKITKTISGLPDGTTPDISFTVTGPNSYSETIYLKADQTQTDRKAMSKAADGTYSYQINNLPTGEYTVTETNAAVTDYSLSATVSVNGKPAQTLPANGVTVEVKAGEDNTATVVFTNTYSSTLGSLTIKKEFVNLSDNSKPQFIIIQVFGPTNSNFETTVSLNAANNWTDTISNLPTGEYTVTENTDNANLPGYNLTTTVKVGNDNAKTAASTTATVPAGGNVTVTFTNAYELKEAKKIELPITKVVTRGEKGNVDPTGARTFTFEAQIEELILGSLDDTPAVQPGEIVVQFNGETLTPKDNRYTFSITVNGAGKETGTLTIFTNEVSNLIVNVHELSQTDSGYAEDECWKYDESRYVFYPSIKDGINDKDYSLNGVHVITDEESFQLSEDDSITFTNVYTKTSTPEIDVPVTGDNSRIGLYMAMMLLSAAGLAVICKRRTAKR